MRLETSEGKLLAVKSRVAVEDLKSDFAICQMYIKGVRLQLGGERVGGWYQLSENEQLTVKIWS